MNTGYIYYAIIAFIAILSTFYIYGIISSGYRNREKKIEYQAEQDKKAAQRQFIAEQRRLMTDKLRYEILKRDGFRCQICGATANDGVKLHVDHIYPVSKGGKTVPENLRTLCERCNMGKGDSIEDESYSDDDFSIPKYAVVHKVKH